MKGQAVSLFGWALSGAFLTMFVAFGYFTFVIVKQGGTLSGAPVFPLLFEVMKLHLFAGYGALGGLVMALLERFFYFLRHRTWRKKPKLLHDPSEDTDTKIRLMRAKRAEEYLEAHHRTDLPAGEALEPPVENIITARDGELTYRVMAYRKLTLEEMMELVRKGLDDGSIQEPSAGGATTVITTIGHGC